MYEYRVLSAAMYSTDERLSLVWDCIERALRAYNNEEKLISPDIIQSVINSSDVESAKKLIEEYQILTY